MSKFGIATCLVASALLFSACDSGSQNNFVVPTQTPRIISVEEAADQKELEKYVAEHGLGFIHDIQKRLKTIRPHTTDTKDLSVYVENELARPGFDDNPSYMVDTYWMMLSHYDNALFNLEYIDVDPSNYNTAIQFAEEEYANFIGALNKYNSDNAVTTELPTPTPAVSATPTPTEKPVKSATSTPSQASTTTDDFASLAAEGKIEGVTFGLGASAEEIKKVLGEPNPKAVSYYGQNDTFQGFDTIIIYDEAGYQITDGVVTGIEKLVDGKYTSEEYSKMFNEEYPDAGYYGNNVYMETYPAGDYFLYTVFSNETSEIDFVILSTK